MAKNAQKPAEPGDGQLPPNLPPETNQPPAQAVTFSPEQIVLIEKMLNERVKSITSSSSESPNNAISVYNLRDPKSIETVKVSRFDDGTEVKWVLGFKDLQNDQYKKTPKYVRYGIDPIRKLHNEPYVTLLLSNDGKTIVEKEVLLIDYMQNRTQENIKVIECKVKETIHDHGVLGSRGGAFGVAIDEKGNTESRPTILAQSKSETRTFVVQLPGFKTTTEFITDFLG